MKSLKYLSILLLPITVYISFTSQGWMTYIPLIIFFGFVPGLELLFKPQKENFTKEQEKKEKANKMYTGILYLMLPIQLIFLTYFFIIMQEPDVTIYDIIGRVTAMGLMCGVIGINVGHELGHRNNRFDEFLGELLLLTSLNTHFLPYNMVRVPRMCPFYFFIAPILVLFAQ
jgi:alkane 1-monooxygenase